MGFIVFLIQHVKQYLVRFFLLETLDGFQSFGALFFEVVFLVPKLGRVKTSFDLLECFAQLVHLEVLANRSAVIYFIGTQVLIVSTELLVETLIRLAQFILLLGNLALKRRQVLWPFLFFFYFYISDPHQELVEVSFIVGSLAIQHLHRLVY